MTMTCKINKLEKPGGQLRIFHTLFGRSATFYGHFRADTVMSEWFTRISSSHGSFNCTANKTINSTLFQKQKTARFTTEEIIL